MDTADYVLQRFSSTEREELPGFVAQAADAVELTIFEGLTAAQNTIHAV